MMMMSRYDDDDVSSYAVQLADSDNDGMEINNFYNRLQTRYLAILGRPIRITVAAVTVAPTALVVSLIM